MRDFILRHLPTGHHHDDTGPQITRKVPVQEDGMVIRHTYQRSIMEMMNRAPV